MASALTLARALATPASVADLDAADWTALIAIARAEQLIGTLAYRLHGLPMPDAVAAILAEARTSAEQARRGALWEAEAARRALRHLDCPVILLKGTAYAAAGLAAGRGRSIGDLDILVPRAHLDVVEAALLGAGWEWVKPDPYDDTYYRRWMHEIPPLIHRERDRMIDVHHTILPLTARPTPDADVLIADAVPLGRGLSVLSPADMIVHAAAHLLADGDLTGGVRNLWDIDQLCREFADDDPDFFLAVMEASREHGLWSEVARALRLAQQVFDTPVLESVTPIQFGFEEQWDDCWFRRRLFARDGWGRATRPATRFAFYVRSHWLRMPPGLLARHLWTKWRRPPR